MLETIPLLYYREETIFWSTGNWRARHDVSDFTTKVVCDAKDLHPKINQSTAIINDLPKRAPMLRLFINGDIRVVNASLTK